MKMRFEKQMVLKGLLLCALGANISGFPALSSNPSYRYHQTGLASSAEVMRGTPSTSNASTPPKAAQEPAPSASEPSRADTPAADSVVRNEAPKICGQRVYVTFTEINVDGRLYTAVNVRPLTSSANSFKAFDKRLPGNFAFNLDRPEVKRDIDNEIVNAVKNRLGSRCSFENYVSVQAARSENNRSQFAADDTRAPEQTPEEKDRLKQGMRECRTDAKGDPLSEEKRLQCKLRRLSEIETNSDRRGAEYRALAEVERIVADLRKGIKNRLMSNDGAKIEEGEELLSDTIDAIKDVSSDLNLNSSRTQRLISGLESLRYGGDTFRRSMDFVEEVRAAKEGIRRELIESEELLRSNPRDQGAMMQAQAIRTELRRRHTELQQEIISAVNPSYNSLLSAQRNGYLTYSEFNQFAQPYQRLAYELNVMSNPNALINDDGFSNNSNTNPSVNGNSFVPYRQSLAGTRYMGISPGITPDFGVGSTYLNTPAQTQLQNASVFNSLRGQPQPLVPNSFNSPYSSPYSGGRRF